MHILYSTPDDLLECLSRTCTPVPGTTGRVHCTRSTTVLTTEPVRSSTRTRNLICYYSEYVQGILQYYSTLAVVLRVLVVSYSEPKLSWKTNS